MLLGQVGMVIVLSDSMQRVPYRKIPCDISHRQNDYYMWVVYRFMVCRELDDPDIPVAHAGMALTLTSRIERQAES